MMASTRPVKARLPATLVMSASLARRSMAKPTTSLALATASRHASGLPRISSSGSFPSGIRMMRTLLTLWSAPSWASSPSRAAESPAKSTS